MDGQGSQITYNRTYKLV